MTKRLRHAVRVVKAALRERQKDKQRSPAWRSVRKNFLYKHPFCAACAGTKRLQVHHIEPFHRRPDLELDPSNLVVLCMGESECHLDIGHSGDFQGHNPEVVLHAGFYRNTMKMLERIKEKARQARYY